MAVVALVEFNGKAALVLDELSAFTYEKRDNMLIGTDSTGVFVDCLYYERPTASFKAFAGREFELMLKDGGVEKCNGQWWSGGSNRAEEILGEELIRITANSVDKLKECYVFCGMWARKSKYDALVQGYTGETFEYYVYKEMLNAE